MADSQILLLNDNTSKSSSKVSPKSYFGTKIYINWPQRLEAKNR